jgi:Tfp pilus assembly protein PilF
MKKFADECAVIMAITMFCCMLMQNSMGQQKTKKVPTAQEMEQMKKKMQTELNKLTPEQRRQMAAMGIEVPNLNSLNKSVAIASENPEARISEIPGRDAARIASIPATPSASNLRTYLSKVHQSAAEKLGKQVGARSESLYASLKSEATSIREMGHGAAGLWAAGRYQEAIYLAGKLCISNQEDADNLNNYAAFLTMAGAEPMAIPLLKFLNNEYPRNSTVLNNLGQAWFGLGDFAMASRYLDSAIRFFPGHSQAQFTKSQIEESKGNTTAAAEAMKQSLDNGFSTEKKTRLRKLGYPVEKEDISWPLHIPQDPLGLHKFVLPAFPHDVVESADLMEIWNAFRKRIQKERKALEEKKYRLDAANAEYHAKQLEAMMQAMKTGAPANAPGPLSARAQHKLSYLMDNKDGGLTYQWKKAEEEWVSRGRHLREITLARAEKSKLIEEKYESLFGEGESKYTMKQYCTAVDQMNNDYLQAANTKEEKSINSYLDMFKKWINTQAYYQQYIYPEPMFAVAKVDHQLLWLGLLEIMRPQFISPHPECTKKEAVPQESKLQEFDDVACQYHSKMDLKFFSIESHCSRMTTKFSGGPIDFNITENVQKNEIIRGSLELTAGKGASIEKGPVKAGAAATVTGRVEFNGKGITDVIVIVKGSVSVGSNVVEPGTILPPGIGDKSVTIGGVEARVGWNSGSSVTGKGILQGVQLK